MAKHLSVRFLSQNVRFNGPIPNRCESQILHWSNLEPVGVPHHQSSLELSDLTEEKHCVQLPSRGAPLVFSFVRGKLRCAAWTLAARGAEWSVALFLCTPLSAVRSVLCSLLCDSGLVLSHQLVLLPGPLREINPTLCWLNSFLFCQEAVSRAGGCTLLLSGEP